jgi:hypothetical protein
MTVAELIEALRGMPPDAVVVRGDADWSGVAVTAVRAGTFYAVSRDDAKHYWENYEEFTREEDETPNVALVKIE